MALVDINWNPSRKELRVFSLLLIGFGVIVAVILTQRFQAPTASVAVLLVTTTIGVIGLAAPRLVRPVYIVWMGLAFPIGWTVSHLMLLAIYYLVLTPIGLTLRLCGRDPMHRRLDRGAKSYWLPRTPRNDLKSYFRQF